MEPTRILILGGTGYTGRLIARHLLEQTGVKVTIAARGVEKAQALAGRLNQEFPGRAAAMQADAASPDSLRSAFTNHALAVIASPTSAHVETAARAALETGTDYLDVQFSASKLKVLQSMIPEIEAAGRCFITEAGFHPGLPSALVRLAALRMDEITNAATVGYLNMGKGLPFTEAVDELMESFKKYQGQVYKDGRWTNPNSYQLRKINFGNDIGRKLCYSMFLEEMRALPELFPSLREAGFYISESHWITDWVIMPVVWLWLAVMPKALRPIGRFLWWGMGTFHQPPYRVELQIHAKGMKAGRPVDFQGSVSHPDGYELTAIPVVAALQQYLDGSARKPGLWMMGHLVDPARLMADMQSMGVKVSTREG